MGEVLYRASSGIWQVHSRTDVRDVATKGVPALRRDGILVADQHVVENLAMWRAANDHIDGFNNANGTFWLSNFAVYPFEWDGRRWRTIEHAFQAMKSTDNEEQERIRACGSPGRAKWFGRHVTPLRDGWDSYRIDLMGELVAAKFTQHAELADKLSETAGAHLEESNTWGDDFWGTINGGVGRNELGRALMRIRAELCGTVAPSAEQAAS